MHFETTTTIPEIVASRRAARAAYNAQYAGANDPPPFRVERYSAIVEERIRQYEAGEAAKARELAAEEARRAELQQWEASLAAEEAAKQSSPPATLWNEPWCRTETLRFRGQLITFADVAVLRRVIGHVFGIRPSTTGRVPPNGGYEPNGHAPSEEHARELEGRVIGEFFGVQPREVKP